MQPAAAAAPAPSFRLVTRGRLGLQVTTVANAGASLSVEVPLDANVIGAEHTSDGAVLALLHTSSFAIVHPPQWSARVNVALPTGSQLVNLHLSPRGSYAAVLIRAPHAEQATANNIYIYDTTTGAQLHAFQQRMLGKESPSWPLLTWSSDESHWARVVSTEVQFGVAADLTKVASRIKEDRVRQCIWSPSGAHRVALLSAEDRSHSLPARVRVFPFPPAGDQPTSQLTVMRADESNAYWAPVTASALLAVTHTELDPSGKSYYGESKLFQLQAGTNEGGQVTTKEGPLHTYGWAPNGKHFAVIAGRMPARVSCFNRRGQLTLDLTEGPYNTLAWSACSRLLMVGGLGNVKGPIAVWDLGKETPRRLCEIDTTATTFAFSPSARVIITAVLSPRLRVENGFKLWGYDGRLLHHVKFDTSATDALYQAFFLPAPDHHEPPLSPRLYMGEVAASAVVTQQKPASSVYRHPNAAASQAVRAEPVKLEPKKYKPAPVKSAKETAQPQLPPGAELADGGKKKKNRRRKAGAAGGADGAEADNTPDAWDAEETPSPAASAPAPAPAPAAPVAAAPAKQAVAPGDSIGEVEKKVKATQKKLRQIGALKADREAGKQLNADQEEKVASEASVQAELTALENKLADMHAALLKALAPKP